MRRKTAVSLLAAAAVAMSGIAGVAGVVTWAQGASAAGAAYKVGARRLTETQYRHTIADVFGPDIKLNARFEPQKREEGLLSIGDLSMSITSSGFEQYYALGKSISDQVLDAKHRDKTVPCKPTDAAKPDDACTAAFIKQYGERLFRRPLTDVEVARRVEVARKGAETGDFYKGLNLALTSLLAAPDFLFRVEMAEADPTKAGAERLDAYTKASRLSFLLWDTSPDPELMAAAKSGALHTDAGLKGQIARMTASPRLEDGARAFFSDMLQLDQFDSLTKDANAYPKFSQALADSAKEQTLKTIVDLTVTRKRDYRDIFTSNETFVDRHLAAVYQMPFAAKEGWTPVTFPSSSERSGILTQVSFLSLFSHPAASSPTKRGVKVHEIFFCEPMPEPPANVDFSKVQATDHGTVRSRLLDHMENEGCASCHMVSDPPGLALEHFDGLGQLRTQENGALIDVSADLDGKKFNGAQGLGKLMHTDERVPACLVRNVYYYGVGRMPNETDASAIERLTKGFAADGYKLPALYSRMVSSPDFFRVAPPEGLQKAPVRTAAANTSKGDAR